MKKHIIAASLLLSSVASYGGGYQMDLQGLRQAAMGGTGVACPWDASTMFYNPGGLARLKGIQAYGSMSFVSPVTAFGNRANAGTTAVGENTVAQNFTPFSVYIGGRLHEDSRFALGLGIYSPFASAVKWDDNWIGKYMVQSYDLRTVFFQPTVSFRAADWLSVGGGFVFGTGSVDYRKALPVHGMLGADIDDGTAHLRGNATGLGYNLGVHIKATDDLQFGISYRSQVNMDVEGGRADFTVPTSLKDSMPDGNFDARLPMPGTLTVGAGYRINDVTLQLDLAYTQWDCYDSMRFDFRTNTTALSDIKEPRLYRNVVTPRLGIQYKVSKRVALMGGAAYMPTPVTNGYVSPDMPDADRVLLSCGITVRPLPGLTFMASFQGISSLRRTAEYRYAGFNGVYKTAVAAPGFGLYYTF